MCVRERKSVWIWKIERERLRLLGSPQICERIGHGAREGHASFITYLYVWHGALACGTWLIHTWDITHSHVRYDWFTWWTWLNLMWDITQSYLRHDSILYETWLNPMHGRLLQHVHTECAMSLPRYRAKRVSGVVYCSVLQCVAVSCSVLQCVAVCAS